MRLLATIILLLSASTFGPVPQTPSLQTVQLPEVPVNITASGSGASMLQNSGMECSQGFHAQPGINGSVPEGWTALLLSGGPTINSAKQHFFGGRCDPNDWVDRIEDLDSLAILAQDIETPPEPGKPFDALVYQTVPVEPGKAYSLSGWMVSMCGGSFSNPNDCPAGYYMAKMLGIDPTGGTDPNAASVIWTEDRRNFVEGGQRVGWVNLYVGARAGASTMTVFARILSPFQHHGNHALLDAMSLLPGPTASFQGLPSSFQNNAAEVRWNGALSAEIDAIAGGTHQLLFDVEYRIGAGGAWQPWLSRRPAGSERLVVCGATTEQHYYFRVRPFAEQPEGQAGAWPNHRYLGAWTEAGPVTLAPAPGSHPPVAAPDVAHTDEDVSTTITVLDNDEDLDACDQLSISAATKPSHGSATVNGQTIIYQPDPDFNGTDSFSYTVTDGTMSASTNVQVNVAPVNDPPSPGNDTATTLEDTAVVLPVLQNDVDIDSPHASLVVVAHSAPAHGSTSSDGRNITYTPALDYNGPDSFTYTVSDGSAAGTATVSVHVEPVNDAPRFQPLGMLISGQGESVSYTVAAVDPEGDAVVYSATGLPPGASLDAHSGRMSGRLGADAGTYAVTVEASDGTLESQLTFTWKVLPTVFRGYLPFVGE